VTLTITSSSSKREYNIYTAIYVTAINLAYSQQAYILFSNGIN